MTKEKKTKPSSSNMMTPVAIVIAGALVALAVLFSNGTIKTSNTGKGNNAGQTPSQNGNVAKKVIKENSPTEEDVSTMEVSVDDDPVLGDADAPLTMIEFSDYECPFCKRAFEQTYPIIKKRYIDTGKVKLVFRDLPLPFHEPNATRDAIAANCARDQKGDDGYFAFHDEVYTRTQSNKSNMTRDLLIKIAGDVGLNKAKFTACLDKEKFADEVKKDSEYASSIGVTGTPTFFIGKSTPSGVIEGTKIVGAQPIDKFTSVIDSLLLKE